jgi:hypothetical protein
MGARPYATRLPLGLCFPSSWPPLFPDWNASTAFPATSPKSPVEWNVAQRGIASEERA